MKWAPPKSTVAIQNGLDYTLFLRDLDARRLRSDLLAGFQDHFWFGTAGRLHAIKNHRLLIEAFARVADRLPNAIVTIVGRGELERELKELAVRRKVADRIFFLGHRNDIDRVLRTLDVFVLPSLQEGLPLALLEAMASARPVIASGVGGVPEVVGSSGCATLIDPARPEQLSEAMVAFYNTPPALREAMGMCGRSRALTAFSAERMIRQYEELFADLCQDHHVQRTALTAEWLDRKSRPGRTPA
jgi:glycosyltransferase involved in cell wall biosynthesis